MALRFDPEIPGESDRAGQAGPSGQTDHTTAHRLRVTVAVDVREPAELVVRAERGGRVLGRLGCEFACALQPCDLVLSESDAASARTEGLHLSRADAEGPVYLLAGGTTEPAFVPQLLSCDGPAGWGRFRARLDSMASLTQFGWMEGCVLDALLDLGMHRTLDRHLDFFFPRGQLVAEDFHSRPIDNTLNSIESTNIFAALIRRRPDHPAIARMLELFEKHRRPDGVICGGMHAAEHCYTVAHPLAVLAAVRGDAALADRAVTQLRSHLEVLRDTSGYWLRQYEDGRKTYRNWSRGVAWLLLGLARTLAALPADRRTAELTQPLAEAVPRLAAWQRSDGLWRAYLDDPKTAAETSGSAGIAAALALAARHGWVDGQARRLAERCRDGLANYLLHDGLLGGMSPSNKVEAGEDVQRSPRRIAGGAAMGLTGQLLASLDR